MSIWRILGLGALVAAVALATIIAVGVWSLNQYFERPLDQWFGEGLLGPEEQRQRVETSHGFAISMAGDWTAEEPPSDPDLEERLGMQALLTMRPPREDALCSVYLASGDGSYWATSDEEPPDTDLLRARLIPWLTEQGLRVSESGAARGNQWGDRAGLFFGGDDGSTAAAFVVPRADDLYVLPCVWRPPGAVAQFIPQLWGPPDMLLENMGAMGVSLEFLPTAAE